jgi:mono/diheme cytochrome c family protein
VAAPAEGPNPVASATVNKYCVQCHGKAAQGGVNLEKMMAEPTVGPGFRNWQKVVAALEQKRMPPPKMPQPTDVERQQTVQSLRGDLSAYAKKYDGDPGRVTMRRLTSGEYAYTIQDLTGVEIDAGIGASSDSAGGEGFTNFGDVQFMQDSNVERYLEAAKRVADHAVIGSGPLSFFTDPGKTGFELSAIARIRDIHTTSGFRTVSGEGGIPFGLEKYGKVFFVTWSYKHRVALGQPNATLKSLATKEGIPTRFAEHVWSVVNQKTLGYPTSEMVARWQALPAPKGDLKGIRAKCDDLQKFVVTWPSWLFARGDVAAGGAGDESPLMFNDRSLAVKASHHFTFNTGFRLRGPQPPPGPRKIYLHVAVVNANPNPNSVIIWHNPTISVRQGAPRRAPMPTDGEAPPLPSAGTANPITPPAGVAGNGQLAGSVFRRLPTGPKLPLRTQVDAETAKRLNFGVSPDGTLIGPDDFASNSTVMFEVNMPAGSSGLEFQVDAQVGKDRDQVYRILLSEREDGGSQGIPIRALVGDPDSAGYKKFKAGVMELAALLPPNSNGEAAPADKDPVPLPFDSTFNVPEHDAFLQRVKYVRDDRFISQNILDPPQLTKLNQAWTDLYASFDYHENYFQMLAEHFKYDLKGQKLATLTKAQIEALPAEMRSYVQPLLPEYQETQAAMAAARTGHVEDCLSLAGRAWRRPLTTVEKQDLRAFYARIYASEKDHRKAVRALIARILVAPHFLYRVEQANAAPNSPFQNAANTSATVKPLSSFELASRISYFLWSSIPDDELLRAAGAGELNTSAGLQRQVKRMLADAKARRLATEFFGQWLGFYHFDEHRGVDTSRFPEFTNEVKESMYDEAISFFEHVIRKERPVRELLRADYAFLNQPLAKHYGVTKPVASKDRVELVEGANSFQRGGLLRLGAVLTTTSAPLRTSPVKRGDWVLRRILGTEVPPPPANAGVLPADDKNFGGLTLRAKLEAHKRNATCASCHTRIDPLGFPLERYDSVGRYRTKYADGNVIDDEGVLADKTQIAGVDGLLNYLQTQDKQVLRTVAFKMTGYALGRTVQPSDEVLIEKMSNLGGSATLTDLATAIVSSRQFRHRLTREETPVATPKPAIAANNSNPAGGQ